MANNLFKTQVETIVARIPEGRVMTYGQIAALVGSPRAARQVGGAAHFGNADMPWQRVVNKQGGLASGYPGGRKSHGEMLQAEGVEVVDDKVDIDKLIWWPYEKYEVRSTKSELQPRTSHSSPRTVFIVGADGKRQVRFGYADRQRI